jgi:hypothetical protein
MEKFSDLIENRTLDLPACSIVPQPTTPPRAQFKDGMGRKWSTLGEKRNACGLLVGKPQGKGPLGRLKRRRKDNIKKDLGEIEWSGLDWVNLVQVGASGGLL